jgi:RNA polymerase sigma-70 factor (ECF subfamily)
MTEKEKILIAGCVTGDKSSWDKFVQQYSALVYHTIRKTLALYRAEVSPDLVEDLFQEVFLSLLKDESLQLRRFRGDCSCASWLRMIAARRTIDSLRKSSRAVDLVDDSMYKNALDQTSNESNDDQLQQLAGAISHLEPHEQIVIDLFYRQNLSAQDVASILRLSVGAVYTQKSRILSKLREAFQKLG